MDGRHKIGFHVFTFAVLMLFARPYLVYQMTASSKVDPARAFSLLQRLVKKKDDHHEEQAATGYAILNGRIALTRGHRLLVSSAFFLLSLFRPLVRCVKTAPTFVPFQRQRYLLTSCLLI